MKFAAIIPDRNDRPELTNFCLRQLSRMTRKPDNIYHINHKPQTERFDLISRVHQGVNLAKADGFDWVFLFENDDYYPTNYFDRFTPYLDKFDFIGDETTIYYNLRNSTYKAIEHPFRSSLFTTAFRVSALNNFAWPKDHSPFLDIDLWRYARFKRRKFIDTGAIGIKHGTGLCGGKGHTMTMKDKDKNFQWLRQFIDDEAFEFYNEYKKKLNPVTV